MYEVGRGRSTLAVAAALLLLGCVGCALLGPRIEVEFERSRTADFSALSTFGWLPGIGVGMTDPRVDTPLLEKRIREAILQELTVRGYEHKLAGVPDFYVAYYAALKEKLDTRSVGGAYGYDPAWGWDHESRNTSGSPYGKKIGRVYEAGSLLLDLVDPKTSKLFWRASAQTRLNLARDSERTRIERIREAVRRMLEGVPARNAH